MSELTLKIRSWGHRELKEYLLSLNGILDVEVLDDKELNIYLKYDSSLITSKIIKMEIALFLNFTKNPSIISFDKHPTFETSSYKIIRDSICCEYCYMGAIDDLFEIEGIEKVEGNFFDDYLYKKYEESDKVIINIKYNPNLINIDKMRQIEINLGI